MADQKLSQLTVGAPIAATDLFYSAQDIGGGNFNQVKQPASALTTFLGGGGGGVTLSTLDVAINTVPTSGAMVLATDTNQLLIGDGTSWRLEDAFFGTLAPYTAGPPAGTPRDLGVVDFSARYGYDKTYVTDKEIDNCRFGFGTLVSGLGGEVRYDTAAGPAGALAVYNVASASWQTVVANLTLREQPVTQIFEHEPLGGTSYLQVFTGDSELLGLNGIPMLQGYVASLGAYPVAQYLYGGSF